MKLLVLAVGKLKDPGLENLCEDYVKRSRVLLPLELASCRDLPALRARAGRQDGPRVVVDERGEQLDTRGLAAWLRGWRDAGKGQATFLLGDSDGFTDDDRSGSDRVLALSRLTLAHRVARVVLVEQLYRAATILAGHPYHHG